MNYKMKNTIYFTNNQKVIKVTKETRDIVRDCINGTLNYEEYPYYAEVSVSFVDNSEIKELNREYRGKDRETDVLSFPSGEGDKVDINLETGAAVLGDIVISLEKASQQAEEYGHSIEREIAFLTVHSCLHLLGYDHETGAEDEAAMMKRQEEILNALGFIREQKL